MPVFEWSSDSQPCMLFSITGGLGAFAAAVVGTAAIVLLGRLIFRFCLHFLGLFLVFLGLFLLFGLGLLFLLFPGGIALGLATAAGTGRFSLLSFLGSLNRRLLRLLHHSFGAVAETDGL